VFILCRKAPLFEESVLVGTFSIPRSVVASWYIRAVKKNQRTHNTSKMLIKKEPSQFPFLAWTLACGRFGSGTGLKPPIYCCHQEL
jgi:hypothetical protein